MDIQALTREAGWIPQHDHRQLDSLKEQAGSPRITENALDQPGATYGGRAGSSPARKIISQIPVRCRGESGGPSELTQSISGVRVGEAGGEDF